MSEAIWAALANRHNFVRWATRGDRERFAIVKVSSEGAGGWANAYAWQRISVCGGRDGARVSVEQQSLGVFRDDAQSSQSTGGASGVAFVHPWPSKSGAVCAMLAVRAIFKRRRQVRLARERWARHLAKGLLEASRRSA